MRESLKRKKVLLTIAAIVSGYLIATWFIFGSAHPCGILESTLQDIWVKMKQQRAHIDFEQASKTLGNTWWSQNPDEVSQLANLVVERQGALIQAKNEAVKDLREYILHLTPAQCVLDLITGDAGNR